MQRPNSTYTEHKIALVSIRVRHTAAALVLAVVLAACGGQSGQPAGSIKVTMTEYKFVPKTITATSGKVVFYLANDGTMVHDMVITDSSGKMVAKSDMVSVGDRSVFTVDHLAPGSYGIYCDLPGHREAGMLGTLQVS